MAGSGPAFTNRSNYNVGTADVLWDTSAVPVLSGGFNCMQPQERTQIAKPGSATVRGGQISRAQAVESQTGECYGPGIS